MGDRNPTRALDVVRRIVEMCNFIEDPAIQEAVTTKMVPPGSMPSDVNSVLKISNWVGLGTVGLWAALDAFAERASLNGPPFPTQFRCQDNEEQSLKELDDIRHLYAHNYAGEADDEYFNHRRRYVLRRGTPTQLTCGAQFDGHRLALDLRHLRWYAHTVQTVLARFS
jgi:hypothetical protein